MQGEIQIVTTVGFEEFFDIDINGILNSCLTILNFSAAILNVELIGWTCPKEYP